MPLRALLLLPPLQLRGPVRVPRHLLPGPVGLELEPRELERGRELVLERVLVQVPERVLVQGREPEPEQGKARGRRARGLAPVQARGQEQTWDQVPDRVREKGLVREVAGQEW